MKDGEESAGWQMGDRWGRGRAVKSVTESRGGERGGRVCGGREVRTEGPETDHLRGKGGKRQHHRKAR